MTEHSQKVVDVQGALDEAFAANEAVKMTYNPRRWNGLPIEEGLVPIAVVTTRFQEDATSTREAVTQIASDNRVSVMTSRDGHLYPRKFLVYIRPKKDK